MQNQPRSSNDLNTVFEKIQEIAEESSSADYIYRGEPEHFQEAPFRGRVSSNLWRQFKKEMGEQPFDIQTIQERMLEAARNYTREKDDIEILTELQHYGGHTNLIDFTTDYHIALFFACDSAGDKDGRVILLPTTEHIEDPINPPRSPRNRVIAQKSTFVRPPLGFLEPVQFTAIDIPHRTKQPMLNHLGKCHGISTETVYNDLHGFIRNQDVHRNAFLDLFRSATEPRDDSTLIEEAYRLRQQNGD